MRLVSSTYLCNCAYSAKCQNKTIIYITSFIIITLIIIVVVVIIITTTTADASFLFFALRSNAAPLEHSVPRQPIAVCAVIPIQYVPSYCFSMRRHTESVCAVILNQHVPSY